MDLNSINGILRAVVPSVLSYAVAKNWIPAGSVADVTAAIITVAAAAWSIYSNRKPGAK
jgi:hypothetical protein